MGLRRGSLKLRSCWSSEDRIRLSAVTSEVITVSPRRPPGRCVGGRARIQCGARHQLRAGDPLVERLAEAGDWKTRFDLLEAALGARVADGRPFSDGAAWAWQRLAETHGRLRVEALCEELGWSRKRLAARFRDEVGLPPKTVARLLRLERAIELARLGAAWAEVAYACGYYDQSHLANEFRRITGASPTQYLAP